jgi:hypothetical protein
MDANDQITEQTVTRALENWTAVAEDTGRSEAERDEAIETIRCLERRLAGFVQARKAERNARARESRNARNDAARSCGLVRVRGAQGGTYWE